MRVLTIGNMFPPHHLGGYELMWWSSVTHLRRAGHQVRVLTTDHSEDVPEPGFPEDQDVHRALRWYWHDHDFPRTSIDERRRIERGNLDLLERAITEFEPDVVAWWAMGGMSLSLVEAVRRAEIPAVGLVVDDWLAYGPRVDGWQRAFGRAGLAGLAERLTGIPTRLSLERAAHWAFVSEVMRASAAAAGFHPASSSIAHGGFDSELFEEAVEKTEWGGRLLYVGRIDPRKGVAVAIRALEHLPGCTLRIVGGGDEGHRSELERLVAELSLGGRVEWARVPRREVPGEYAAADATIFPVQWEEPWGLVPLESMAVGTPVVATGSGGSGEYLRSGENCILYEPRDDPAALAGAVEALSGSADLRARLRAGGLRTAADNTEHSYNARVMALLEDAR